MALIRAPAGAAEVEGQLVALARRRAVLDLLELSVRWLGFLWGTAAAGNPLLEGYGIPSSAALEVAFSAAGFELTPNVPSRASTPEAIWQAALWWWDLPEPRNAKHLSGVWCTDHVLPDGEARLPKRPAPPRRPARR